MAAVRKDGTSDTYIGPEYPAYADPEVVMALSEACRRLGFAYGFGMVYTVLYLVYELQNNPPRQVITSSLIFIETLLQVPDLTVNCCSGELRRWNLDFVGYQTRECFERWHPDIAFLTCTSYRPGKGLYKIVPCETRRRPEIISMNSV